MRSDFETLRRLVSGLADPAPTSDGLAARRPRRETPALAPVTVPDGDGGPYPYDPGSTLTRRSSSVSYAPEPLEAGPLLASARAALAEDRSTWGRGAEIGSLELFVILLRPRGAEPGVYRVRTDGVDLLHPLPEPEVVEGMTVQKEFSQAGAIISAAADLDEADAWAGAHGYRYLMMRSASIIYSVHLRAAARGLTGTVFAGLSPSSVRGLLDSDGVSRHQMFAVTVALPRGQAPS